MASCFTAALDVWEEGRSKGLLHHLSAIGGGHSHLSAQSSALGPLSRPLPSNADSSPQLPGACSPEMLWHICPGFKSPLATPCQCSHTAVRPPCCTYVLLEKPSPQPLVSVFQVSLSLGSRLVDLLQTPRRTAKLSIRLAVPPFPAAGSCQALVTAWGKGDPL